MADFWTYILPCCSFLLSVIGVFIHALVAHRLKCSKPLSQCLREDSKEMLSTASDLSALSKRLDDLEASLTFILTALREVQNA